VGGMVAVLLGATVSDGAMLGTGVAVGTLATPLTRLQDRLTRAKIISEKRLMFILPIFLERPFAQRQRDSMFYSRNQTCDSIGMIHLVRVSINYTDLPIANKAFF
jgi:hypothetical protein